MVETDVELILGEIRDRVRAAHQPSAPASNGGGDLVVHNAATVSAAETLALINSYLTTTARSWDQFPPLVSNRKGLSARFELWLKRFFRRGTRWYVWEQINFNAAIHHALSDLLPLLAAYEHELENRRAETAAVREQFAEWQAEVRSELATQRAETQTALRQQNELSTNHNAQIATELHALLNELRERDGLLRDEQRVCYKQINLEMSEAATLEDRSRRKTETLLAEIQRRLEELEKK
jgi:hypothetical protein